MREAVDKDQPNIFDSQQETWSTEESLVLLDFGSSVLATKQLENQGCTIAIEDFNGRNPKISIGDLVFETCLEEPLGTHIVVVPKTFQDKGSISRIIKLKQTN